MRRFFERDGVVRGCVSFDGKRLPRVREVADPAWVGVHRTGARVTAYVGRDVDEELGGLVGGGGFVLLVGDSAAGKSRAAFEAVRGQRPGDELLVPRTRADVAAAAEYAMRRRGCVLWLDDLERFVGGADGLNAAQVAGLVGRGAAVLVCATLRVEERGRLLDVGRGGDESNRGGAREVGHILRLATTVHLNRRFSPGELTRAESTAARDPRVGEALAHADWCGVAEYLAAGPQLLAKWHDGWAPGAQPRGAALVAAAVDARRAGFLRPATRELLVRLHELYLEAAGGTRLRPEPLEEAFTWAEEVLHATAALLHVDHAGSYVVFDYLVDNAQRQSTADDHVPAGTLRVLLDYSDPVDTFAIIDLAIDRGWYDLADTASGVLNRLTAALPGEHPDALAAAHYRARIAMWQGDYQLACDTYRDVLGKRTAVLGDSHHSTLATRHDYAWTLSACGSHAAAEHEFTAVVELRTSVLGGEHRLTLSARHNLAWVIFQAGDPPRAKALYEEVLALRTKTLGYDHEATLTTRHDLARVAARLGDHGTAEAEITAVLTGRLSYLSPDHPYVLTVRHDLAALALAGGRLADAEKQFAAVLDDRTRVLGSTHTHVATTRLELARVTAMRGNIAAAQVLYRSALDAIRRAFGADNPTTLAATAELAALPESPESR
ncbi:tetratricopeptide (TPR) repeat protein [Actinokineospora baliensis]|uniref:tetratricopeptide repeat protein n=1 Tax=Actinokineospora baliensis TaxID=547056 RepID=UPI00195AE6FC|nr:tetratricopeptide repeat protein [Actinokineospora baliensis]MBM7774740.1 tetratricopeptide (TPR) repeat protein [Actinokineospora baliensis]